MRRNEVKDFERCEPLVRVKKSVPRPVAYLFSGEETATSHTAYRGGMSPAAALDRLSQVFRRVEDLASIDPEFRPLEEVAARIEDLALYLGVGTAVGAIFAGLVFVASAFSLPMMLDRNTDAITSALTSINAVKSNIPAMLVWAALIVSLVLVGFATAFVGFAVVLPWIGHATWHAYRETIAPAEKIKVYD